MRHKNDLLQQSEPEKKERKLLCRNKSSNCPSFLAAGIVSEEKALDYLASILVDILLSKQ